MMKSLIFILILFHCGFLNAQLDECIQCFIKVESKNNNSQNDTLYNIVPQCHRNWNFLKDPHPISCLETFQDTISILKSLLEFEGDTSFVSITAMNYSSSNPNRTDYFVPDDSLYRTTLEIHALFLFNLIIEPKQFYLATYPRLQAKKLGSPNFRLMFTQNDARIIIIFAYYKKWLENCERKKTLHIGYYPLDGTNYSWL